METTMYDPRKYAKEIIEVWTKKLPIENIQPLIFNDSLAELFFYENLCAILKHAYRCGIRAEQKRRKKKAIKRWKEGKIARSRKNILSMLRGLESEAEYWRIEKELNIDDENYRQYASRIELMYRQKINALKWVLGENLNLYMD